MREMRDQYEAAAQRPALQQPANDIFAGPLYAQVQERFRQRILSGEWSPGRLLPAETELAASLRVSLGTVRKALDGLQAEGLIERHRGRGTVVRDQIAELRLRFDRLRSPAGALSATLVSEVRWLGTDRGLATEEEHKRLALPTDNYVLRIFRLLRFPGDIHVFERLVCAAALLPDLVYERPPPSDLTALLKQNYEELIHTCNDEVRAVPASTDIAAHIRTSPGTPVLQVDRVARNARGTPLAWSRTHLPTADVAYVNAIE